MDKRKLSGHAEGGSHPEMVEMADRMPGIKHMVTAELVDDNKILLLNFFEVSKLKKGKTEAAFRTFLSSDDYITQDLSVSKVKWITACIRTICRTSTYGIINGMETNICTSHSCSSGPQDKRLWKVSPAVTAENR